MEPAFSVRDTIQIRSLKIYTNECNNKRVNSACETYITCENVGSERRINPPLRNHFRIDFHFVTTCRNCSDRYISLTAKIMFVFFMRSN